MVTLQLDARGGRKVAKDGRAVPNPSARGLIREVL
jgi:hypothetical protein